MNLRYLAINKWFTLVGNIYCTNRIYWNLLYFHSTKKEESKPKSEEQILLSKELVELLQIIYESNPEKFFKDNIQAEIQKSDVAVAIKNATDNFVSSSNEQMEKFTESLNNNTFATAIRILDSVIAELSFGSLENAKKILERI